SYPLLRQDPEAFLQILANEIALREMSGETPRLEEYLERFPEHEAWLRRQFAIRQQVWSSLNFGSLPVKDSTPDGSLLTRATPAPHPQGSLLTVPPKAPPSPTDVKTPPQKSERPQPPEGGARRGGLAGAPGIPINPNRELPTNIPGYEILGE